MESPTGEALSWLSTPPQQTSSSAELSQAESITPTPVITRGMVAAGTSSARARSCSRPRPASSSQQRYTTDSTSTSSGDAESGRANKLVWGTRTTSKSRSPTPMRALTPANGQSSGPQRFSICTPPEANMNDDESSNPKGHPNGEGSKGPSWQRRAITTPPTSPPAAGTPERPDFLPLVREKVTATLIPLRLTDYMRQ